MNKYEKFLSNQFKVKNDSMGIPSIVIVEGSEKSLVTSRDREYMLRHMERSLVEVMILPKDIAHRMSSGYIENRYKEYMDFVINM